MQFLIVSDLHLEFHRDFGLSFLTSLPESDGIILAGDITSFDQIKYTLNLFCEKYSKVIYILGNHEYYNSNPKQINKILKSIKTSNLHVLENEFIEVGATRIHGTTLWFKDSPLTAKNINDFHIIDNFVPWVYDRCQKSINYLKNNIRQNDIVITHHLPSYKCVSNNFKNSPLNPFFVCDVEEIIHYQKPKYWIHGHTHDTVDFDIENTKVICNPFGYPNQLNHKFNINLSIEI